MDLADGYEDLAASLGADVAVPAIAANKQQFEAAVERFKAAVAAKPGLTVAAMSPADDMLYVANPEYAPELLDYQRWGLKVINPDTPDPGFPYWENLSWENADKYQPDLILWDGRSYTATSNDEWGAKQPTWFSLKAAKAKAVDLVARVLAAHVRPLRHRAEQADRSGQGRRRQHRHLTTTR